MFDITLNNGVKMPVLGLGVYKTLDPAQMQNAINSALKAGYRSFDTAQMYKNEDLLGQALLNTDIKRQELFLTSKVDTGNMGYQKTLSSFADSLEKLQTDYLDLFLIHWPGQKKERLQETWKALEELYNAKKIRAIGVCNCTSRHLTWIMENSTVIPAINQVERHPLLNQAELITWCAKYQIHIEAWAPLLRGSFDLPKITALAEKYKKSPAQIILRWDIQEGVIVIPKSVHEDRIIQNADIFDFELSPEDMDTLNQMNTGHTTSFDVDSYDF